MWCFWLFRVNKTIPRPLVLNNTNLNTWKSIQYALQQIYKCLGNVPAQNYIWNKSRRGSHIPGTGISSLIMQIRPGPSMPNSCDASAGWIQFSSRATEPLDGCSTCGSGRPLLMQQHVQKTISEDFCFLTLHLHAQPIHARMSSSNPFICIYSSS